LADAVYDAIVVGGGHHGTIIACYLQKAGLKTAVFERQMEIGGGACGEDLPLPGFIQNPCAHFTRFWAHPAYTDFNLREKGLQYVFPEQNEGMVFDDGSSFIGYSCLKVDLESGKESFDQASFDKTYEQISRFSRRDAETYALLFEKYEKYWKPAFREYRYSPPTPYGEPDALERLCLDPDSGLEPVYQFMTGKQLAYDFFESPELRTLFMRAIETSCACFPGDVIGLYGLVHTMALVLSWESASIVLGGTHTISHALQRAFSEMGGQFFVHHEVERVLIENGKAVGVELVNGSRIKATQLVVSDLGVPQTVFRLLGEEYVSPKVAHRVRNIDYDRAQVYWGNVALHELPRYTAAATNPDLGPQPRLYFGPKDPDYLATRYQAEVVTKGWPSKMFVITAPDSIWDPTRAHPGKHSIIVEEFAPPFRFFSEREWLQKKREFVDELFKQWARYAPNMTKDNLIEAFITTPLDVIYRHPDMIEGGWVEGAMHAYQLGRFRPVPELSNYRTPVKNFYICSSNLHSAGGIGRGSSYNCYKVIAADFGLEKFWETSGRSY
jgi:phytoene dehydrogenase-like protein